MNNKLKCIILLTCIAIVVTILSIILYDSIKIEQVIDSATGVIESGEYSYYVNPIIKAIIISGDFVAISILAGVGVYTVSKK